MSVRVLRVLRALFLMLAALLMTECELSGGATPTAVVAPTPTAYAYHIENDIQYIDLMVPHHQLAIDMARIADQRAQHGEVKGMARDIIVDQQDEINRMSLWRGEILAATPGATGMSVTASPQAVDHAKMPGMDVDLNALMTASDFDHAFITAMIPHHQSAIEMSRQAIPRLKHPALRDLANDIIHIQQMEIDRMNRWLNEWFK